MEGETMTKTQAHWLLALACCVGAQVLALTLPRGLVGLVLGAAATVIAVCVYDEIGGGDDAR